MVELLRQEGEQRNQNIFPHSEMPHPVSTNNGAVHDRYRLFYSGHFLRLAEVTQTVSPINGYVFHNRLSHSLKVGVTAGLLAKSLKERYINEKGSTLQQALAKYIDPVVAECAGYAHDIGHPPFGHIAEEELDKLARSYGLEDGFEGNAQTFRIASRLGGADLFATEKDEDTLGLDLTRATMAALLKYPWKWGHLSNEQRSNHTNNLQKQKWGIFDEDEEIFEKIVFQSQITGLNGTSSRRRTIEAEIMDWADDMTFAVHDLLDFYCSGQIPLFLLVDAAIQYQAMRRNSAQASRPVMPPEWRKFVTFLLERPKLRRLLSRAQIKYAEKHASRPSPTVQNNAQFESSPNDEERANPEKLLEFHLAFCMFTYFKGFNSRYTASPSQRRLIAQTTTILINEFSEALGIIDSESWDSSNHQEPVSFVRIEPLKELTIEILKQFTWHYVIVGHSMSADSEGSRFVVKTVAQALMTNAENERRDAYLFPEHMRSRWSPVFSIRTKTSEYLKLDTEEERWTETLDLLVKKDEIAGDLANTMRENVEKQGLRRPLKTRKQRLRDVIDYVASMSEPELMRIFKQLTGHNSY